VVLIAAVGAVLKEVSVAVEAVVLAGIGAAIFEALPRRAVFLTACA
jgi:hypothetical protein